VGLALRRRRRGRLLQRPRLGRLGLRRGLGVVPGRDALRRGHALGRPFSLRRRPRRRRLQPRRLGLPRRFSERLGLGPRPDLRRRRRLLVALRLELGLGRRARRRLGLGTLMQGLRTRLLLVQLFAPRGGGLDPGRLGALPLDQIARLGLDGDRDLARLEGRAHAVDDPDRLPVLGPLRAAEVALVRELGEGALVGDAPRLVRGVLRGRRFPPLLE